MTTEHEESRPVVAVAVGIVVENGRLLICRRPDGGVLGGHWEFPGGKIEPGETPAAAAVRELREELGITVEPAGTLAEFHHDYPHARIALTPVFCRRTAGEPQAIHVAAWQWVCPADLPRYAFPAANASLLHRLMSGPLQIDDPMDKVARTRAISSAG